MPSSLSIHSSRASMNSFCSFVKSSSCIIRFKGLWCTYFPPAHQRLSEQLLGLLIVFCYVSLTLLACACEHTPIGGITPVRVLGVYQCADIPVGRVTANPSRHLIVHRCGHIDLALFHFVYRQGWTSKEIGSLSADRPPWVYRHVFLRVSSRHMNWLLELLCVWLLNMPALWCSQVVRWVDSIKWRQRHMMQQLQWERFACQKSA